MIKVRPVALEDLIALGFAQFCQAARDASYFSGDGQS